MASSYNACVLVCARRIVSVAGVRRFGCVRATRRRADEREHPIPNRTEEAELGGIV